MMDELLFPLNTQPGIMRDYPVGKLPFFTNGDMVRATGGGMRTLGGWIKVHSSNEIIREMFITTYQQYNRIIYFSDNFITQVDSIPNTNIIVNVVDRTPTDWVGPTVDEESFLYSVAPWTLVGTPVGTEDPPLIPLLFFLGLPNAKNIGSSSEKKLYFGRLDQNTPFTELITTTGQNVRASGGVVVFNSYVIVYGNEGVIRYSKPLEPLQWENTDFLPIGNTKVIASRNFLNSILFWSLNQLIQVQANPIPGGSPFISTLRCPNITILSPRSIVDGNDNTFYWISRHNFFKYNGVLQRLPNPFNKIFFFANVNDDYLGKVFGVYLEDFTEIWWSFVDKTGTENNRMITLNLAEQSWCDNTLSRSCALVSSQLPNPFFASSTPSLTISNTYPIFEHEIGWDHVENDNHFPITSYIETNRFSLGMVKEELSSNQMRVRRFIPDIKMGDAPLKMRVQNYPYLQSNPISGDILFYYPNQGLVPFNETVTYGTIQILSDELNSWFQTGSHSLYYLVGSKRPSVPSTDPLPPEI